MENDELPTAGRDANTGEKLKLARELITEIFNATDLRYLRLELWIWFKSIHDSAPWSFMGDPSMVLYIRDHLINIMAACQLLLEVAESTGTPLPLEEFSPFSEARNQADRAVMRSLAEIQEKYQGLIRRLTLGEAEQPLLAIKHFFATNSLDEWIEILQQWVECALSKVSICEVTGECAEVNQYELLERLIEAVYLIWIRHCEMEGRIKSFNKKT